MTPGQSNAVHQGEECVTDAAKKRQLSLVSTSENQLLPAFREYPSRLFVETTTRCNLRCSMCVKQTRDNGIIEGDISPAVFSALEPALPHAETLILNGIGEPLLHPHLEDFIRTAKGLMPEESWVGFQTNGLLLDEARAVSLVEAGLDRICLSLDSVCPDSFRKIREGGEISDMENALAALNSAKRQSNSKLQIGLEFVVMRDNARELPAVLRWAVSKGVDFAIVTHLLPYDKSHVDQLAYDPNSAEALEFFRPWQERAEREGIDLRLYFKVMWNYLRSPEEQRVVDFVKKIQADAHARDIFFHMKNLMDRDDARAEEIEGIFSEARSIAAETGLDLKLPETMPKSGRNCDFIDKGSAFISWDGGVHTCYFLWHQFSCYFDGRKKYVSPRVFGNLGERGIKDIWNDPGFLSFRKEALLREYPTCSNCNLVACENIYNDNFEQDCFANKVPCGDCFWCMGLFRCLQ